MKYIEAEKLIAEIERRKIQHEIDYDNGDETEFHRIVEDNAILKYITSLQREQPEVDLEKEIYNLYDGEYHDTEDVARHFYELGLNARKE